MLLEFPIITYLDGRFAILSEYVFFSVLKAKFEGNRLIVPENRYREMRSGWIVDAAGRFIKAIAHSKSREWLRPFFLWNFVLSEYHLQGPRNIGVGELAEIVGQVELPLSTQINKVEIELAEDLEKFLLSMEPKQLVSADLLAQWPL